MILLIDIWMIWFSWDPTMVLKKFSTVWFDPCKEKLFLFYNFLRGRHIFLFFKIWYFLSFFGNNSDYSIGLNMLRYQLTSTTSASVFEMMVLECDDKVNSTSNVKFNSTPRHLRISTVSSSVRQCAALQWGTVWSAGRGSEIAAASRP